MELILTEKAAGEIKTIIEQQELDTDNVRLRVGVKGGGCSGFTYNLKFDNQMNEGDQVLEQHGVKVVCDPKSYVYLDGSEVDFTDGLNGRGFVFKNPNEVSACGCGESVSLQAADMNVLAR